MKNEDYQKLVSDLKKAYDAVSEAERGLATRVRVDGPSSWVYDWFIDVAAAYKLPFRTSLASIMDGEEGLKLEVKVLRQVMKFDGPHTSKVSPENAPQQVVDAYFKAVRLIREWASNERDFPKYLED